MASYVQLHCPTCDSWQLVDKQDQKCRKCGTVIERQQTSSGVAIISDRLRVGSKMSSEFRTGVLDKIMSVKGAANANRKYG